MWDLYPKTSIFMYNRKKIQTQREGHVKTKAGVGVTHLQAKEHLETPEAGRGKEGFCLRAFRVGPNQHLDFRLWLPEL